jgi:putative transposase
LAGWVWRFFVNPSEVEMVIYYIGNQHAHHSITSFQDEYRGLLKLNDMQYDERYVWD